MGLIEISPPTVLSPRVARFSPAVANNNVKAEPGKAEEGATEAPLPLTPQRLELIKSLAETTLRRAEGAPASRIAERFAPRAPAASASGEQRSNAQKLPGAPLSALASEIRTLTAVLILAALLPNLTLAAFWLGLIDLPWTQPVVQQTSESPVPLVRDAIPLPVLSTPRALQATAGEDISFPIALDGTDGVPPRSIIAVSGLPDGASLSSGRQHGGTEWILKPDEIGDLHLLLPDVASGEVTVTIQLVAPGDRVVADASTLLEIAAAMPADGALAASETEPDAAQASDQQAQALEEGGEDVTASVSEAPAEFDLPPLPTRRPAPPASDDAAASWVRSSAYVNLRDGPSSSAKVVGVVAKGTKLRVIARKSGWVQVSNPATAHSGWIYSGHAETLR